MTWNKSVARQLLGKINVFFMEASAYVRMDGELRESFPLGVGIGQGCVISPWLFDILYMDACMREIRPKLRNVNA